MSPHLKTLVELKAQDAVTSLSIVYVPETAPVLNTGTLSRADSVAAGAGEAEAATAVAAAAAAAAAQADENGSERGDRGSPIAREGSNQEDTEAEKVEAASPAGVYVAAGLETGVVEVLRLSSRREGTRVFDLVRASERSDRMSSSLDAPTASRSVDEGPDTTDEAAGGSNDVVGGDHDANEPPDGGNPERSAPGTTGERSLSFQVTGAADDRSAPPRLDREGSGPAEHSAALPEAPTAATSGPTASVLCGWHVPAECKSSESWTGRGLVVGFSDTGLGTAPFAGTPRTPLDRAFGKAPRRGWGKAGESVGGRGGGRTAGGDEQQVFAVCTMDGCVRCCQVVSNAEGQPRWKKLWTRQTKASSRGGWVLVGRWLLLLQGGCVAVVTLGVLHAVVLGKLSCLSSIQCGGAVSMRWSASCTEGLSLPSSVPTCVEIALSLSALCILRLCLLTRGISPGFPCLTPLVRREQ